MTSCVFQVFFHVFSSDDCREPAPTVFDLLLVEGSFSGGLRATCAAPLAVPLH